MTPAVQTKYPQYADPTPPKRSLWLIADGLPDGDLDEIQQGVLDAVRAFLRTRAGGRGVQLNAGIAETEKLWICERLR